MNGARPAREVIRFGVFELDLRARELRKQGRRVPLQGKPFEVLTLLVEKPGAVVSRDELRGRLWPGDTFVVFDDNLNAAVKKVRDALGDVADSARFVETVPRYGYKFIAGLDGPSGDGHSQNGVVAATAEPNSASTPEVRPLDPPTLPPTAPMDSTSSSRRGVLHRLRVPALLVAGGMVLGAAVVLWWRSGDTTISPVRVTQLTLSGSDSEPSASPDGRTLAFTSRRDGVSRIWWKQLGGGGDAALTPGPDHGPRFFPDGLSVLYLHGDGGADTAWRVPLVGGAPQHIVDNVVEAEPALDGLHVAFVRSELDQRERVTRLGVIESSGANERIVCTFPSAELASVRWSPDGRTIAAVKRTTVGWRTSLVFVTVVSGSVQEIPVGDGPGAFGALAYTGDGSHVVVTRSDNARIYVSGALGGIVLLDVRNGRERPLLFAPNLFGLFRSTGGNGRLDVLAPGRIVFHSIEIRQNLREVRLAVDGGGDDSPIATFGNSQDRQPAYSPDGNGVVFSSNRSGNLDLWMVSRAGGEPSQFTNDPAQDWDPAITPDGRHVLWSSTRSGPIEIWTEGLDRSGARQLTQDGMDAENPTMGKDSDWIVYTSNNPQKAGIWRIKLDGSQASRLVAGTGAFRASLPDMSPSGQYALYREDDPVHQRSTIRVIDVNAARAVRFEIAVSYHRENLAINPLWGRARWMPDGRSIVFVAQDASGRAGLYAQDFQVGRDTSTSRRQLVTSLPRSVTESFGISPDGKRITVSDGFYSQSLMLTEGLAGIEPPRVPR